MKKLLVQVLIALALAACRSEPMTDSNTNWLRCDETSQCGDGGVCVCGVCTKLCDAADCPERGGVCVSSDEQDCVLGAAVDGAYCLPPELSRSSWVASASSSNVMNEPGDLLYNPPENALDGDPSTRWSSGKPQAGDEWFQIDFGQRVDVWSLWLDVGENAEVQSYLDYPREYAVSVSDVSEDLTAETLRDGTGSAPLLGIPMEDAVGRYLMVKQTGQAADWWSIHEIRVNVESERP